MNTITENINNIDLNGLEFTCYKFYTDVMEYNWKDISTVEDYIIEKKNFNQLQNFDLAFQKIDLRTGNIVGNIFSTLGGLDKIEIDLQNNVTLTRNCIYFSTHTCIHHQELEAILEHESQTLYKSYYPNSYNLKYIYKKSIMADELLKINVATNDVEERILLTNKISDIPELYFNNLPTDFINLITKQKIAIKQIGDNDISPFVVYKLINNCNE